MKQRYIIAIIMVLMMSISTSAQKKYDDIYYELGNMTLDQAYSELMEYQLQNPFFSNVYLQIAMICERKMINTDPLRENELTQFWGKNAQLFFNNFHARYKTGDAKHDGEYYKNLHIKQEGKFISEEELSAFIKHHETMCKNYTDSTLLIYNAFEASKRAYNVCLEEYSKLCAKYINVNTLMLMYDEEVRNSLDILAHQINVCKTEFAKYQKLLQAHPILAYRQVYDIKEIETYRLDGLTNSDFLNNRFFIWDFEKWTNEVTEEIKSNIEPMRKNAEQINAMYSKGMHRFKETGKLTAENESTAYDEKFNYLVGRYEQNSLLCNLFDYLEARRELIVYCTDSLANTDGYMQPNMQSRRLRHLYNIYTQTNKTKKNLDIFGNNIKANKIALHKDFFARNYNGTDGVKKYAENEEREIDEIWRTAVKNYKKYLTAIDTLKEERLYSLQGKSGISIPMFECTETELQTLTNNNLTTGLTQKDEVLFASGHRKQNEKQCWVAKIDKNKTTEWVSNINKMENIGRAYSWGDDVVVTGLVNGEHTLIELNEKGKEKNRKTLPDGSTIKILPNDIEKHLLITYKDGEGGMKICMTDSMLNVCYATPLAAEAKVLINVTETNKDIYVFTTDKQTTSQQTIIDRQTGEVKSQSGAFSSGNALLHTIYRISANSICKIGTKDNGDEVYEVQRF